MEKFVTRVRVFVSHVVSHCVPNWTRVHRTGGHDPTHEATRRRGPIPWSRHLDSCKLPRSRANLPLRFIAAGVAVAGLTADHVARGCREDPGHTRQCGGH